MSHQQQQQNDAPLTFPHGIDAGDVASQGETTSVETPEGRPNHPDIELSRGNRDRDFNLRQVSSSEQPDNMVRGKRRGRPDN